MIQSKFQSNDLFCWATTSFWLQLQTSASSTLWCNRCPQQGSYTWPDTRDLIQSERVPHGSGYQMSCCLVIEALQTPGREEQSTEAARPAPRQPERCSSLATPARWVNQRDGEPARWVNQRTSEMGEPANQRDGPHTSASLLTPDPDGIWYVSHTNTRSDRETILMSGPGISRKKQTELACNISMTRSGMSAWLVLFCKF